MGTGRCPIWWCEGFSRAEPVYAVRFPAAELWGSGTHSVILDLWESYLDEAA